ncbi:hypothetical protein V6S65_10215 [Lactococcus lactis]|uniref:hypothetical protein n=1 Tax=Lactococcus lactis TaxID=1358 RepID=UPI002FE4F220
MSEEIQGWRDIIQQNGKRVQPQLTIPKSIADLADKEAFADSHTKFKIFIERYELNRLDRHLNLYCCTEEGRETVFAYMNPSTRDLVKVVEG